jgi:hypothetical protein
MKCCQEFCDNCGNIVKGKAGYPITRLRKDIASANKGESALLCCKCYQKQIEND